MEIILIEATKIKAFVRQFLPDFNIFQIVAVLFFTLLNLIFIAVAFQKNEFSFFDYDILFNFTLKILFDASFLLFSILILKAVFRINIFSAIIFTANIALVIANILLYYFGNTLVERGHFALITPYSVTSFVPWYGFVAIFLLLASILAGSFIGTKTIPLKNIFKKSFFWLSICILLNLLSISGIAKREHDERFDRVITGFRNAQIYYASKNQWIDFISNVIFPSLGDKIKMFSPATEKFVNDYNLFSEKFSVSENFSPYQKTIDKFHISLGKRNDKELNLKQYSRVIYIFTESLSLDALPCHNKKIQGSYANRFFCREDIFSSTFTNLVTSGSPTLQGLTVTFNSHPNYNIQEITGQINSFPKILEQNGFKSVFIRSASKLFANENLIFKKMGFSKIIGREDFFEKEELKKYIYGWGLEDRILYEQVIDFIKENKDKKLFLTILGTDTHPPLGQIHYKYLQYPKPPKIENIKEKHVMKWLTSVDRMDFDIDNFLKKLDAENLFDESTLIVISADHSCPFNNVSAKIPGHSRNNLARIPLIFLSKQPLPETDYSTKASQIDIAPTIFHLLSIPKPLGWWGKSLFDSDKTRLSIGFDKHFIYISDGSATKTINTETAKSQEEKDFLNLFDTVFKIRQ